MVKITAVLCIAAATLFSSCGMNKSGKGTGSEPSGKPLNVLFIVSDDLNNTVGCYGHPIVQTPNIDKLASKGLLFRRAYNNFAGCNPSRSSFLTGLRPETLGVLTNQTPLGSVLGDRVTLPALFRQNGYYTFSVGKVFHGKGLQHDPNAWDEEYHFRATEIGKQGVGRNLTGGLYSWCKWLEAEGGDEDQQEGQTAAKAIEFLKRDHEKPFFLGLGMAKPHDPFIAPKKYFEPYPLDICTPPEIPEGWTLPYEHTVGAWWAPGFATFTDQERREYIRAYYACTSFMDAQLGKVLDALEEEGLMENTVIVFFGDHGFSLGEHNWWNKGTLYETSHHTPLIIVTGNEEIAGKETDAMVEFLDFYPTLASMFDLEGTPAYLEGESFEEVLEHPETSFRDHVTTVMIRENMMGRAVKTNEWRYTEWDNGAMGRELYNQLEDPYEYNNLADQPGHQALMEELSTLIIRPE